MPNWVSNNLRITGSSEEIKNFKERASQPNTTHWDGKTEQEHEVLSFMNFIAPPQEAIASGEYYGTHGWEDGKQTGNTKNNWYEFNNREWGTKWDASDADLTEDSTYALTYYFQTAWSMPTPVFEVMASEHPNLVFSITCVEEQGWGVEYESVDGELITTDEWDIPDNHEDSMRRTQNCICEWVDPIEDRDQLWEDCPSRNLDTEDAIRILEEVNPKF
jgi:hypothetical protein